MKIERTKNAARNIYFGVALKVYQILMPFFMRTVMIYTLGFQYVGLNSLFTSILQVLNLAELGVGSAMVYSMYRPIAEDDRETICCLLGLYRKYYRVIGLVIGSLGLLLMPSLPKLIRTDTVPADISIYRLYLMNLAAVVLSYWMYAYKNSLLTAHQRNDVISKVTLATGTVQYALQFAALIFFRNYYFYMAAALGIQMATNLVTAGIVGKMYPDFRAQGELERTEVEKINGNIRNLFTSRIGMVVVYSSDSIVISAFLGLTALAVYQNYYFIMNAVMGVIGVIFHACMAGIGNSLLLESREKNSRDLLKVTFLICWISCVCSCFFLNLYQPFIRIWIGEQGLLPFGVVVCLVVYFFFQEIKQLLNAYKDAAGIWREDRFRPLAVAMSNLSLNLLMVRRFGIYGVVLSTVIATLFVGMPWLIHNLFTYLLEKKQMLPFVKKLLGFSAVSAAVCVLCFGVCSLIKGEGLPVIFARAAVCALLPNGILWLVYRRSEIFLDCLTLLQSILRRK